MNGLLLLGAREGRQRQVRGVVWCGGEATVQPRRTGTAGNCSSHHRPTRHGSLARFLPACSAVPWGGRPAVTAGLSLRLTSNNLAIQRHGVGRPLPLLELGSGGLDTLLCSSQVHHQKIDDEKDNNARTGSLCFFFLGFHFFHHY
jgi:hypothetical protein